MQEIDLFGKKPKAIRKRETKFETALNRYDKTTFEERLKRLEYINRIYPGGLLLSGDMEFVFTFSEIKECFIAGHFIATIVLSQAFIEKIFHQFFLDNGETKIANEGLASMVKFARKGKLINSFILDKVDDIRLKRNPFTHIKEYSYPHTLQKRMLRNNNQADKQLESDAKEAIQVLFFIVQNKL